MLFKEFTLQDLKDWLCYYEEECQMMRDEIERREQSPETE